MDARTARLIRFGDFELDVRAGELRKQGIRIRLQDQSFQILLMLLDRPGEVLLRDEIRLKLWPNNTIVEFDHSINAAIKRLRNALGESAEEPRFIETLAKRGYRFSGQVRQDAQEGPKRTHDPRPSAAPADGEDFSGKTFSNYRVLERLGSGGMGVVHRADDLKLGRQVALKFLQFPADELPSSVLERFEREARAASALNHPHICTVYSVDSFAGQPVIVMELVEGETLEARLARGPLKQSEAIALAIQIADVLAEAHRKGIVHRDLKPANVMLTKSGAKVLDFGLAKMERPLMDGDRSIHQDGRIIGTLRYMSPEQAQGAETDARADVFSFGVVLQEMLGGTTPLDPPALDRIVRRCLAKDPDERWQSAADLKTNLEWLAEAPVSAPSQRRDRWAWAVAAAATLGLAAFAWWHFTEQRPAPAPSVQFQLPVPEGANLGTLLNLSPDGRKLAFLANRRLWVHSFGSEDSRDLTDARGTPFWSPDSRFIAYAIDGKIKRIEATGGPAQTVTDYSGGYGGGTWNQDDLIVFSNGDGGALFQVPAAGGTPVQIGVAEPARHEVQVLFPQFLPDGRHFLYTRRTRDESKSAIYLGSVDTAPEKQSLKPLVNSYWAPQYAPSASRGTGYLLFMRGETLVAQPFDNRRLELTGLAAPVAEQMGDGRGFSVSTNVLVYERNTANSRLLTWYDRDGKPSGTIGDPGNYRMLAYSPDGTRAALSEASRGQASSIWLLDLSSGTSSRFAFGSASNHSPVWSADGSRIVFSSNPDGALDLYLEPANRAKDAELLLKTGEDKNATSWSPDGRLLLFTQLNTKTKKDMWVLPLDGDKKPLPFLVTQSNEGNARFSPDGRWVAYESDESGNYEIYVRSFSMNAARTAVDAGGKWQVSKGCGIDPHWRSDGRELYYLTCDGYIMAAEIAASPDFKPGTPRRLGMPQQEGAWGASSDGQRFLKLAPDAKPQPYTVVLNWQAGLKK
jgi:Tol biopolymer transport system component/DNA-binding winged helix-turn-helix (wHTH) protein